MTAIESTANWRSSAACRSADPDLFFPVPSAGRAEKQVAQAKLICAGCRVRRECLEFALAHAQTHGIWGGTTPEDRQRDRRRRRRAAAKGIVADRSPDHGGPSRGRYAARAAALS
jgi:WhiB family transcriptional regulator, redox-sensing transcriptional regulator